MNTIKFIFIGSVLIYFFLGALIYVFQEHLIFLPSQLERDFQFQFDHEFEEHFLTTRNGGEINLLHFKSENPKALIVYFHGNAGSLERWGDIMTPFIDLGYDVLIPDYRGYGKSIGKKNQKNLFTDAEAVYALAKKIAPEDKIILFGRSLGSGFASFLASKNNPSKIILETPFFSLEDIAQRRFLIFPTRWFLRYHLNNYEYLNSTKAPVYIFHGTHDEIVAYQSGEMLFNSLHKDRRKLISIVGGAHNNLSSFELYWKEMKKALAE